MNLQHSELSGCRCLETLPKSFDDSANLQHMKPSFGYMRNLQHMKVSEFFGNWTNI